MSHIADAHILGEGDVHIIVTDVSHLQPHALNSDGAHGVIVLAHTHAEYDMAVEVIEEQIDIILAPAVVNETEGSANGCRHVILVSRLTHTRHNTIVLCCHRRHVLDMEHSAAGVPVGNTMCKISVVRHISI